ncbi:MAG TPA: Stk1 family PASTA domain-containing Ser/Thr kinase [Microcella sp.]|nr:Stk1 family PASTA domain-containing Ser/Thr kinase [Microcella sp.]
MDSTTPGTRLIAGRYELGALIGRGGMSDVHLATDARLGRRVALKLLKSSLASDPVFRTRFRQEAQAAARMAHPTIVRVFDAGEETSVAPDGHETVVPFIVMEYVEGRLLRDMLLDGPLPAREAGEIVEQVLTALEYSHRAGVVHRDVKPGNIMVTPTGQVKVMDFGIARAISDSSATVAQTSTILGTAQYFSPEQARGETVDARTDLYSTGVVLFEMLTGRPPFRGDSPVAVAYQHVSEPAPTPSSLNPEVSPALDAVVLHAMAKDRFQRFQTAAEFRADVSAALAGQVPPRRTEADNDPTMSLFGVNPQATAGTEAAMRQLTIDDDRRTRTQTRPPVAWIWSGIVVVGVLIAAVLFWAFSLDREGAFVANVAVDVPNVVGLSYEDGESILVEENLRPTARQEQGTAENEGQILRTEPAAGFSVSPGQEIVVFVSTGPPRVQMPDVRNLDLAAATAQLEQRGLVVGTVTRENSGTVRADIVIRTDPGANTELREGDAVDLTISNGLVAVPDLRQLPIGEATRQASALGLQVSVQADPGCSGGIVTGQSLAPGDQPQDSPIRLVYCSGGAGGAGGDAGTGADTGADTSGE